MAAPMPRIPTDYVIAGAIALAVALWMASGMLLDRGEGAPAEAAAASPDGADRPFEVEIRALSGETITRRIVAQGQVLPERAATLRARTDGQVVQVAAEAGQAAHKGQVLVRLSLDDREARLREAEALLRQREAEFEAAQQLSDTGFQARLEEDRARTALESARAAVERIRLDIWNTDVTAPFDGVVDRRHVDVGDYVGTGDPVVDVVDNDPLTAVADLSQRHFDAVHTGAEARVTLVSGETRQGRLKAIAPRAEQASRTFRVEVEVANPQGVPANTSAEIEIPVGTTRAHRLSPALLVLDDDGRLGVKTVRDDGRVAFVPVEIERSDAAGVWVSGLEDGARVITVGAGFVTPGDTVRAIPDGVAEPPGTS